DIKGNRAFGYLFTQESLLKYAARHNMSGLDEPNGLDMVMVDVIGLMLEHAGMDGRGRYTMAYGNDKKTLYPCLTLARETCEPKEYMPMPTKDEIERVKRRLNQKFYP
ncbi:hypothetical protein H0H92_010013, partial [Tricholoma furcatifolium]